MRATDATVKYPAYIPYIAPVGEVLLAVVEPKLSQAMSRLLTILLFIE